MNKSIIVLLAIMSIQTQSSAQLSNNFVDTILIPKSYKNEKITPRIAYPRTTIFNLTDTLYLLNSNMYNNHGKATNYKDLAIGYKNELDSCLARWQESISSDSTSYFKLLENCKEETKAFEKTIDTTNKSLIIIQERLNETELSLKKANNSLNRLESNIKKSKKMQLLQKLGIGGGGVAIGILISLLLN